MSHTKDGRAPRPAGTMPRRDLLAPLVGRDVEVRTVDGSTWRGQLREVGLYELTVSTATGPAVLHKGAVVAVTTTTGPAVR